MVALCLVQYPIPAFANEVSQVVIAADRRPLNPLITLTTIVRSFTPSEIVHAYMLASNGTFNSFNCHNHI